MKTSEDVRHAAQLLVKYEAARDLLIVYKQATTLGVTVKFASRYYTVLYQQDSAMTGSFNDPKIDEPTQKFRQFLAADLWLLLTKMQRELVEAYAKELEALGVKVPETA
jgi:hypothetical protein